MHPFVMVGYFNIEVKKTETWDKVTNSRIALLHPQIRQKAVNFINEVEKEFDIQIRVTTWLRTIEEQNRLYEQGRTTSGFIVTWVIGEYSYHNYGLVIDVIEMIFLEEAIGKSKKIILFGICLMVVYLLLIMKNIQNHMII